MRTVARQKVEVAALYGRAERQHRLDPHRMRADHLHEMITQATINAHREFQHAVKKVGGSCARWEFVPPRGYRVVMPANKMQGYKMETVEF